MRFILILILLHICHHSIEGGNGGRGGAFYNDSRAYGGSSYDTKLPSVELQPGSGGGGGSGDVRMRGGVKCCCEGGEVTGEGGRIVRLYYHCGGGL